MPVSAFGPQARAYADRLPSEPNVVVFDDVGFAAALDDALERAFGGGPFLAAPILADRRAAVALDAAAQIVAAHPSYAQRRACLDLVRERRYTFGDKSQLDHETPTKKERDSLGDVLLAADGVVVRSWTELQRLANFLDQRPVHSERVVAPARVATPALRPRNGAASVLVWAPELDARQTAMFALALEELRVPVVIACAGTAGADVLGVRASFVDAADGAALEPLLDQIAAIVDASVDDPAATIGLAARGLPLAAAFGSGAHEYVDGLYLFDAWDYRSILHAVLAALGGEAPALRSAIPEAAALASALHRLTPPTLQDPPLVSVIVSTLNRHGILPRAIDSIARQTYPNVEAVVVNDGGAAIDSIVAPLARVTVINNPTPRGASHAQNMGFDASTGKYVVFLSDDDYLLPTHLSRHVYALERTGGTIAAGMCADSYLTPGDGPYYDFIGLAIRPYRAIDLSIVRTIPHAMPAFSVVRRDAQAALGAWNSLAPVYDDYERIMQFLCRHDCRWISRVTGNMDSRLDQSNHSGRVTLDDRLDDLSRIWANDPCPDRPDIQAARSALLTLFRERAPAPQLPLHRGVTRLDAPKRAFYKLA